MKLIIVWNISNLLYIYIYKSGRRRESSIITLVDLEADDVLVLQRQVDVLSKLP